MSEVKFTPGPWAIHTIDHSHWVGVPKQQGDGLEKPIFKIESDPFYKEEVNAEALANAKLIAAAPEMLSALKQISIGQCGETKGGFIARVKSMVDKVIDKATQ